MKKLALALVCLVSVAFFASCDPEITNPEPSIAIMTGENYAYDGQTIDLNTDYLYGIRAASNAQTLKELASFKMSVKIYDMEDHQVYATDTTYAISGTEYVYQDTINYRLRDLVGKVEITSTVMDADGKSSQVTIKLNVNQPAQPLTVTDFVWNRHGGADATGLEAFGLQWTKNERAIYAVIEPLENASLFKFNPNVWEQVTTDIEKAAIFENMVSISQWKEFNTAGATDQDLDFVLGTIYNNEYHLMHITHGHIQTFKGTDVTLTGQAK